MAISATVTLIAADMPPADVLLTNDASLPLMTATTVRFTATTVCLLSTVAEATTATVHTITAHIIAATMTVLTTAVAADTVAIVE